MTAINYKPTPKESCQAVRKDGAYCLNPAKMEHGKIDGIWMCGVHAAPILRKREQMGRELTMLELWDRGAYGARARGMTTEDLRERQEEISYFTTKRFGHLSEARRVKLRAEEYAITEELSRRANA